jgi:hypothetical protein
LTFSVYFNKQFYSIQAFQIWNKIGNPVEIRDGPAAVIGDKSRILPLPVYKPVGRRGDSVDPKVRRPA